MNVYKKLEYLYNYSGNGEDLPKKKGKKKAQDAELS